MRSSAFQQARGHLVEQLGVEPGPRLLIWSPGSSDHDERLRGGVPSEPAAARPTGTVTFGFCEVEDAARLWATNRKKTAAAMARLDELVRAAVNRQGGFFFATAVSPSERPSTGPTTPPRGPPSCNWR